MSGPRALLLSLLAATMVLLLAAPASAYIAGYENHNQFTNAGLGWFPDSNPLKGALSVSARNWSMNRLPVPALTGTIKAVVEIVTVGGHSPTVPNYARIGWQIMPSYSTPELWAEGADSGGYYRYGSGGSIGRGVFRRYKLLLSHRYSDYVADYDAYYYDINGNGGYFMTFTVVQGFLGGGGVGARAYIRTSGTQDIATRFRDVQTEWLVSLWKDMGLDSQDQILSTSPAYVPNGGGVLTEALLSGHNYKEDYDAYRVGRPF